MNLKVLLYSLYVLLTDFSPVFGTNVTFDNRAFVVDGARTMIIAGSIHYPRMNAAEWPHILKSAKANGINLIQTYVFWDIHEPSEGSFYFPNDSSSANLVEFIKECDKQGLFVNLRFGPYVCAEWNYGGFPAWLRELEGVEFRTMNDPFLEKMTTFVDKTLEVVSDAKLLASEDGPIIMVQIENEFGNMEPYYPQNGADYVQWNAEYALSKNLSIPWMMCQVSLLNDVFSIYMEVLIKYMCLFYSKEKVLELRRPKTLSTVAMAITVIIGLSSTLLISQTKCTCGQRTGQGGSKRGASQYHIAQQLMLRSRWQDGSLKEERT